MSSHLFVVHGDISQIICDAWVMSANGTVSQPFFNHKPHEQWLNNLIHKILEESGRYSISDLQSIKNPSFNLLLDNEKPILKQRTDRINTIIHKIKNYPLIYSLDVVNQATDIDNKNWLCSGLITLLDIFKIDINDLKLKPLNNRERFLIAVPVIGTGGGGSYFETGKVVKTILGTLLTYVNNEDLFDICLCVYDRPTLIAAQKARLQVNREVFFPSLLQNPPFSIPNCYHNVFEFVDSLAKQIMNDNLVIFIGSDCNKEIGSLTQKQLLDKIAKQCSININTPSWVNSDTQSKAEIINLRAKKKGKTIGSLISNELSSTIRVSMQDLFLAGLGCSSIVTTNYNQSFENAHEAIYTGTSEQELNVIPVNISKKSKNWLLKLNGCTSSCESIIATRQDYLRYMETNAALAGIVQAKLLTSHLLFVGFSLDDETFHRIMDSVLKAQREQDVCLGTSLQPLHNPFTSELWEPLIQCASMVEVPQSKPLTDKIRHEAHRQTEIVLDLLLLIRSSYYHGFILDHRFSQILDTEEYKLQKALQELQISLSTLNKSSSILHSWPIITETLKNYGSTEFLYFFTPKYSIEDIKPQVTLQYKKNKKNFISLLSNLIQRTN